MRLTPLPGFRFVRMDIADRSGVAELFSREKPQRVVNPAAQAGVRYTLKNPNAHIDANIVGFTNFIEARGYKFILEQI